MRTISLLFLACLFCVQAALAQQQLTLSGYIREAGSGETLPFASVSGNKLGVAANAHGYFSLQLTKNTTHELEFRSMGYHPKKLSITLTTDSLLTVYLEPAVQQLQEVTVSDRQEVTQLAQMSRTVVPIEKIQELPALFAEKDVLKTLQMLPGVQAAREGNAGLYVRGGSADQNLILLDDAPVYNAFHLFGFLSTFNADAIKHVELIKGGFPARYGGRLASVVNVQMKEGNREQLAGKLGVGLLSSRLSLEGPLLSDKTSFLLSARRSYVDLFTGLLTPAGNKPYLNFGDLTVKLGYEPSPKHRFSLSTYAGRDNFRFTEKRGSGHASDNGLRWGNQTLTLRWQSILHPRLFSNTALIYSRYGFKVFQEERNEPDYYFQEYRSAITNYTLKTAFDYFASSTHTLKAGLQLTHHRFTPQAYALKNTRRDSVYLEEHQHPAFEQAYFAESEWSPLPVLHIHTGLRYALFKTEEQLYSGLEPRISLAYELNRQWSLKTSYALSRQFMHLLSNSGVGLPTDLWVPATDSIPPQQAQQLALGLAHVPGHKKFVLELEGFYKPMRNILAYKDGASFMLFSAGGAVEEIKQVDWQENVTSGQGLAYGAEVYLQKPSGRLTGWLGYTLSWTRHQFPEINEGAWFYARHDRRHDAKIVTSYALRDGIHLSAAWVYGSGQAITLPEYTYYSKPYGITQYGGSVGLSQYSKRNQYRAAPYHRLDLGIQFIKQKKQRIRTWEVNVYNAYSRINPYYYSIGSRETAGGHENYLYYVGLFPVLPSVSYQLQF